MNVSMLPVAMATTTPDAAVPGSTAVSTGGPFAQLLGALGAHPATMLGATVAEHADPAAELAVADHLTAEDGEGRLSAEAEEPTTELDPAGPDTTFLGTQMTLDAAVMLAAKILLSRPMSGTALGSDDPTGAPQRLDPTTTTGSVALTADNTEPGMNPGAQRTMTIGSSQLFLTPDTPVSPAVGPAGESADLIADANSADTVATSPGPSGLVEQRATSGPQVGLGPAQTRVGADSTHPGLDSITRPTPLTRLPEAVAPEPRAFVPETLTNDLRAPTSPVGDTLQPDLTAENLRSVTAPQTLVGQGRADRLGRMLDSGRFNGELRTAEGPLMTDARVVDPGAELTAGPVDQRSGANPGGHNQSTAPGTGHATSTIGAAAPLDTSPMDTRALDSIVALDTAGATHVSNTRGAAADIRPSALAGTTLQQLQDMRATGDTRRRMVIRLDPPELGAITLELTSIGDELRVVARAESPEAVLALLRQHSEVRAAVETQGMSLEDFDVQSESADPRDHDRGKRSDRRTTTSTTTNTPDDLDRRADEGALFL